jgi:hypothetical protein
MKLVDMQGLKPCPLVGPGSSPGIGTNFRELPDIQKYENRPSTNLTTYCCVLSEILNKHPI